MLMDEKKRLSNRTKLENVNSIFMNKVEHFVPIELFIKLDAPWQVCPPPLLRMLEQTQSLKDHTNPRVCVAQSSGWIDKGIIIVRLM